MVEITTARFIKPSSNPGTSSAAATEHQEETKLMKKPLKVLSRQKGTSALGTIGDHSGSNSRTEEQFKVADHQSAWFHAIENKDCKRLMELLAENPRLLVETGEEARTVLHVASIQGCLRLVNQVMGIVGEENVPSVERIGFSRKEILKAIDGRTMMTAFDLAWLLIGNKIVARRLDDRPVEEQNSDRALHGDEENGTSKEDHLKSALLYVIQKVLQEDHNFEDLKREFGEDVTYNFELSGPDLIYIFHHAIITRSDKFVVRVIEECADSEMGGLVYYLLCLQDWNGRPSILLLILEHCRGYVPTAYFWWLIDGWLPSRPKGAGEYMNIGDSRGWTPLHWAATFDECKQLFVMQYGTWDVNATLPHDSYCATPLHLAILHGSEQVVEVLVDDKRTDLNAILMEPSLCIGKMEGIYLSPLTMAVLVGNERMVGLLLSQVHRIFDIGKYKNYLDPKDNYAKRVSAFHVAAAKGNPNMLRLFLDNPDFDPLVIDEDGNTTLHYATDASIPYSDILNPTQNRFRMYCTVEQVEEFIQLFQKSIDYDKRNVDHGYTEKQGCINMLLQAGVDIWQKNHAQKLPNPGPRVTAEDRKWWHDKIERETFQVKTNLNGAGNAISVIAALVATASYVGPLQPPLGYGSDQSDATTYDFVQATKLLVRVYMVANSLSFYFAIASIMFAVVPSLPMPQEGILEELERTRRAVALAIGVLLMSIVAILISFAVASIMVVPEEYSWDHAGLTFYPAVVGVIFCFIGILLFFVRMLRLVFPKSKRVRKIYRKFVKI